MARSKKPRGRPDVDELLSRFAAEEEEFLKREFLVPALPGGRVRVRMGGVVCGIRVEPADFTGWGVFQPVSYTKARLIRRASLWERRRYLALFPSVGLIICRREGNTWFGSTASFGDRRIRIEGLAAVNLAEEVRIFDCVRARYDGSQFWFDEPDMRHDPAAAAHLRSALGARTPPEDLKRRGLTAEERAAYDLNYWELVKVAEAEKPLPEGDLVGRRLRESLSHAGARLVDYLERSDSFRVSYVVDGRRHTTSVDKDDLSVQVAGICLSGEDRKFDLASLVGVLREGEQGGEIYEVGGDHGMDEEEYWQVHPPRDR